MNNNTAMDVVWKIVGVIFMLLIATWLQVPGVLIDLLILGVYYEMVSYSKTLAKDVGYDDTDLKKRLEDLEKKVSDKS